MSLDDMEVKCNFCTEYELVHDEPRSGTCYGCVEVKEEDFMVD